jgi:hypothetical protein
MVNSGSLLNPLKPLAFHQFIRTKSEDLWSPSVLEALQNAHHWGFPSGWSLVCGAGSLSGISIDARGAVGSHLWPEWVLHVEFR